jgi:Family of unknown function (DUF6516)
MESPEHTLEFLLAFDSRRHWYEGGYHVRFQIMRVEATNERPHGLRYSFTLHNPKGKRLIGFDNAHGVRAPGGKKKRKGPAVDHWHRTEQGKGRLYAFKDAETLVSDFFAEVERVLMEHGVPFDVVEADDEGAMI